MTKADINRYKIPSSPGIYIFSDSKKRPIYIGRATNLRSRIKSYFRDDLIRSRGPRIVDMIYKSKHIKWVTLDTVLESILAEAKYIKRYMPAYNVAQRDDKSMVYVVITKEKWPRIIIERVRDFESAHSDNKLSYTPKIWFGPYSSVKLIKECLAILRKIFPYFDEQANESHYARFYKQIHLLPNALSENDRKRYLLTIKYLTDFLSGRKERLIAKIRAEMKNNANKLQFEEAQKNKKMIFALEHINDVRLYKEANLTDILSGNISYKIEAYDVSHISGTDVVGIMVASIDGRLSKSDYRKFLLKNQENNDLKSLKEIVNRRLNHSEWNYPDQIVLDGNENAIQIVKSLLSERRLNMSVCAVTKDDKHNAKKIVGEYDKRLGMHIYELNAEAHRFAINYHRFRRNKRNEDMLK